MNMMMAIIQNTTILMTSLYYYKYILIIG